MAEVGLLPGGVSSSADGINDAGVVVGRATSRSGPERAVAWKNGHMLDLGTLGGPFSTAKSVTGHNQMAGFAQAAAIVNHAVIWTVTP